MPGDLSENFSRKEFECPCCGKFILVSELIHGLQELRDYLGMPVTVNSATRCARHNKEVGGVNNSLHTRGMAADICVEGISIKELVRAAEEIKVFRCGGIGIYSTFVHVDVRGHRARWKG